MRLRDAGRTFTTILLLCGATLVTLPLAGGPPVVRLAVVLLAGLLAAVLIVRPWRWPRSDWEALANWAPTSRVIWIAALVVGAVLFWVVLTRFRAGEINAVDFTVYYDRPNYQTLQGRWLFVESADDPLRAQQSYLSVHAHWIMLPLAGFYAIHPTPLWMLGLSVAAVVVGAVYVLRILQLVGLGGLVATASALAFLMNDNTARTLIYGFHVEVLYAWFIPWLLFAGLSQQRGKFLLAAVACAAVKEDAFLPLAAASLTLALIRGRLMRWREVLFYLIAPCAVALLNLALYYGVMLPRLRQGGAFYANYWASYGRTPRLALLGMLADPGRVVWSTLTSGLFGKVLAPHCYLPLLGWRWTLGIVPIVLLYGASDNEQLRSFGIYYAIVLVPFLVLGAAAGAMVVVRKLWRDPIHVQVAAAAVLVVGSLLAGITDAGYSLRPWKTETAAVPRLLDQLHAEPVVLVQSGLYPHAGYDSRTQLLTMAAVEKPENAGAAVLLAPSVSAWPLSQAELNALTGVDPGQLADGIMLIRLPKP
jgi:uncharacterized membrane protein